HHPRARHADIWVITDRQRSDQVVAAIDAGATTFLVRPLDAMQLRSRIELAELTLPEIEPADEEASAEAVWIVEHLPDAIAILGPDGRIRFASSQFESVLGYTSDALVGIDCVSLCHPADVSRFLNATTTAIDQREHVTTVEVRFRHAAGEWQDVDVRFLYLRDTPAAGELLLVIRDDTSRRDREQQLERQAFYDPLTHLANRALFMEHLSQALARAERFNRTIAVMYIDLDAFKRVNDRYGHLAGDAVLVHVARQIRQSIRANDVAARLSGDEFIVLIEDFADDASVHVIARRIQEALQQPLETEGQTIVASASIGIGFSQPGTIDTATILRDADRALYQDKAAGRRAAADDEPVA
ncbi:MAG: diguanylate cyclase domain-containing protein, partial [Vicinamibacterales bacterium]